MIFPKPNLSSGLKSLVKLQMMQAINNMKQNCEIESLLFMYDNQSNVV